MILIDIVFKALALSGLCAFLIIAGKKTGALDWLQVRAKYRILYELLGCNFCLGFWLSIILATLAFVFWLPFTWPMVLVPIISTAFNNTLVK